MTPVMLTTVPGSSGRLWLPLAILHLVRLVIGGGGGGGGAVDVAISDDPSHADYCTWFLWSSGGLAAVCCHAFAKMN